MEQMSVECSECGGTGLYSGMAEARGCAVVCYRCDGSGKAIIKYNVFTRKKTKPGVRRVFAGSFGYGHSPDDVKKSDGHTIHFSQAGCTYDEWLRGKHPKPVEDLYCPYLWSNQSMQNRDHKAHAYYQSSCSKCLGFTISECPKWNSKSICWEKYYALGAK